MLLSFIPGAGKQPRPKADETPRRNTRPSHAPMFTSTHAEPQPGVAPAEDLTEDLGEPDTREPK